MTENEPRIETEEDEWCLDEYLDYDSIESKTVDEIGKLKEPKIVPTYKKEQLKQLDEKLDDETVEALEDEGVKTVYLNVASEQMINPEDIGHKQINKNLTNKPMLNDKAYTIREISLNKRARSSKSALLKLAKVSGVGSLIHIPLWHSGFWVTLKPFTNEDILNLELDLVNNITRAGKDTAALAFTNSNVLFAEVIFRHFKDRVLNTSVKLDEDTDLEEIINVNDLYTIAWGMATVLFPRGFNAIIPCKNTIDIKDKKLSCTYKANVNLDLSKLLWVDTSLLNVDQKAIMSRSQPNSVTIDEVKGYQKTLISIEEIEQTYTTENGDITIIYKSPTVERYMEFGKAFIDSLHTKTNELLTSNSELQDEEAAEAILSKTISLQLYNSFINEIILDDAKITSVIDINEALTLLSSNSDLTSKVIGDIKQYINKTLVSTIGIPNFVCPTCRETQSETELIALSVYEYFFTLLHSRYEKVTQKM